MNAEFQRLSRRDKKAFLSDQCKEIEENNRVGKTRDLIKKLRDTKETVHEKMGTIKDRNGMDLTKQKMLRRGGKNTEVVCHSLLQWTTFCQRFVILYRRQGARPFPRKRNAKGKMVV